MDGRDFETLRSVELEFGSGYGSAEVRLGNTHLAVQVSASVVPPRQNRPFEGVFHITTDVSSMASPKFQNNRPGPEEVTVSRLIEKSIRRSAALDLESLCIVAGKKCWCIRADVHYLDYDGGLVDATCIGVIAALQHFRRPDTSIDGDEVIIHSIDDRPPVPLSILHVPICVTWSFLPDDISLVDATAQEQELRIGEMTITINKDNQLCQVTKVGPPPLSPTTLHEYCNRAHEIAKSLTSKIQAKLKDDFATRNRGNLGMLIADNPRE